jgi:hypothetical protein
MEERDQQNRANFLPEIECDSAKPNVRSRKDIYPTGLKNCLVKCIETRPPVFFVKDDHGEILEGTFYAEELQKVITTNDVYKIEPILKKRKMGQRVGSLNRTYKSTQHPLEVTVL